jgi:uncharacterized protein (TIGR00297 family)
MLITISFLLGLFTALFSIKLKLLTLKGAAVTFVFAVIIFYFGEVKWTLPMVTFFILSSFLSKIKKSINPQIDGYFTKSDTRDHYQVLANGGFPLVIMVMYQFSNSELYYTVYVSAISAVCSDTWATEIGTMFKSNTRDILSFSQVDQGVSGGVSAIGLMGAVLGASIISLSAVYWLSALPLFFIIIAAGFLGNIFDSVLGASLQTKYKCVICEKTVEQQVHCSVPANFTSGLRWLNNNKVNFAASIFGGITSVAFASFFL